PVHLNFPLREPLMPRDADDAAPAATAPDPSPYIIVDDAARAPADDAVAAIAAGLRGCTRGLIVCGPNNAADYADAVGRLGAHLHFPILADPLSQVRCGPHDRGTVVDSYDAFLRVEEFTRRFTPEVVLRFGALPTSKPLVRYLEGQQAACRQIFVDTSGWNDTALLPARVLHADPRLLCARLLDQLRDYHPPSGSAQWCQEWIRVASLARNAIARHLEGLRIPFEGKVFAELAALLPSGVVLYASNSMPVRDLDTFFPSRANTVRFLSNRGANGIDGVISSALGAGAKGGAPLVLAIGDLAFYHDSNGLLAAKLHRLQATIVLLNNNGGGIFSFLPQADHPEHFEQLFGTPHGLDFSRFAAAYDAGFTRIATWEDFRCAVAQALKSPGVNIVEVPTERASNVRLHREVWAAVASAILPALGH
ncbi:MAG TPA: thiamine pyrophosphate-dependent enzyme, partial [Candidatus Binataceae bacterium]